MMLSRRCLPLLRSSSSSRSSAGAPSSPQFGSLTAAARTTGRARSAVAPRMGTRRGLHLSATSAQQMRTPVLSLPVKEVEVWSVGGGGASDDEATKKATIAEIRAAAGSYVEVGDVVALLDQKSVDEEAEKKDEKEKKTAWRIEVRAPESGKVVDVNFNVGDEVGVGDAVFTIDTDDQPQQEGTTVAEDYLVASLEEHIQKNGGQVTDDFFANFLEECCAEQGDDGVVRMRSAAYMIRDRYPNLLPKSLTIMERVLEVQKQKQQGGDDASSSKAKTDLAETHADIGILFQRLGDLNAAVNQMEEALKLRKEAIELSFAGDDQHRKQQEGNLVGLYMFIGHLKNQMGDLEGAFEVLQEALDVQKRVLGDDHHLVAASLTNLGAVKYQMGDFDAAVGFYERGAKVCEKALGSHAETAGALNNLGIALMRKNTPDPPRALECVQKALQMRIEVLGDDHPDVAASHSSLAQMASELGHFEAALEQHEAAFDIHVKTYGDRAPVVAATHNDIGAVHYQMRNFDKALEHYGKGLDIMRESSASTSAQVAGSLAGCLNNVGLAHYQKGDLDKAMESHLEAKEILAKEYGESHPGLAATIGAIGNVHKSRSQYDEALEHYKTAHQMLESSLGPRHPDVGSSYNNMGQVFAGQGKFDDALTVYRAALEIFEGTLGSTHPNVGACHFNCGLVHKEKGDAEGALEEFVEAKDVWKSAFGPDHPQIAAVDKYIDEVS